MINKQIMIEGVLFRLALQGTQLVAGRRHTRTGFNVWAMAPQKKSPGRSGTDPGDPGGITYGTHATEQPAGRLSGLLQKYHLLRVGEVTGRDTIDVHAAGDDPALTIPAVPNDFVMPG